MKAALAIIICLTSFLGGCAVGPKPVPREGPVEIGHYSPPPANETRPRVAVAPFHVTSDRGLAAGVDLSDAAADEMAKLMDASARFNLIERVRLGQMLREQNQSNALEPGEWLHPVVLPGVSFVVLGRLLSLNVSAEDPAAGFGVSKMQQMVGMGEDKNHRVHVTVNCSVDVRLIDPATGAARLDVPRTFQRTATAAALGLELGDRDAASLTLRQNEAQGILRMILDEELRQMLPQVDAMLQSQTASPTQAAVVGAADESAAASKPTTTPVSSPALHRICPECGADVSIYDEFCPNCNARLPHLGGPYTQPVRREAPSLK